MYRRNDPRLRRTLNEISQTIENANETAQTRVFVFGQEYISPCLSSIYSSFQPCVEHCFPSNDPRESRRRSRGRPELNFDFYDDWEEDENTDLLGWDDEEYDSFVSGPRDYGATTQQPPRQRAMTYGAGRDAKGRHAQTGHESSAAQGPSYFGFLGKITRKLGTGKNLRYKPSAAGLQEHPGAVKRMGTEESEPLMTDDSDASAIGRRRRRGRNRSGTTSSQQTSDSLSSRGDLFPSEDEDDAIPLDEEFARILERRTTGSGQDDGSSGLVRSGKRPGTGSRRSTRTASSRSTPRSKRLSRTSSTDTPPRPENLEPEMINVPTLTELKQEEDRIQAEEESSVQQRRDAAQRLAAERGLTATEANVRPDLSGAPQSPTDGVKDSVVEALHVSVEDLSHDGLRSIPEHSLSSVHPSSDAIASAMHTTPTRTPRSHRSQNDLGPTVQTNIGSTGGPDHTSDGFAAAKLPQFGP